MKSAFELALERSGGALSEIPDDIKNKISEIDNVFKSKIAEAELAAGEKIVKLAGDAAAIEQVKEELTVEIASLKYQFENKKEACRKQ